MTTLHAPVVPPASDPGGRLLQVGVYALVVVGQAWIVAIVPLIPQLATRFSMSGFESGALVGGVSLAMVVASVPAGVLADRFGADRLTCAAAVVLTVSLAAHAVAPTYALLLVARLVYGVAMAVFWTAGTGWMAEVAPVPGAAIARVVTFSGIGTVSGPPLAGLIVGYVGVTGTFALGAALAAMGTTLLLAVRPERQSRHRGMRVDVLRTCAAALRVPTVAAAAAALAVAGLGNGIFSVSVPLQLSANGLTAPQIGIAFGVGAGIFIAVSSLTVAHLRHTTRLSTLALAVVACVVAIVPATLSDASAAVVLALCLTAACRAVLSTAAYPIGAAAVIGIGIGTGIVMGLLNVAWALSGAMGAFLAGGAIDLVGPTVLYGSVQLVLVVALAAVAFRGRGRFGSNA